MLTVEDWLALWLTMKVATLAILLLMPPGLILAWILARYNFFGKAVLETAVSLPLVLPPVATGLMLLICFGRRGFPGAWLEERGLAVAFTWVGVMLALMVMSLPLVVRAAQTSFSEIDRDLEDAARTQGAGSWQVLWHVTLPLARRGILAGAVLGLGRALGEFGATVIVAGNIPGQTQTIALALNEYIQLGDNAGSMRMLVCALVLSFSVLWLGRQLVK